VCHGILFSPSCFGRRGVSSLKSDSYRIFSAIFMEKNFSVQHFFLLQHLLYMLSSPYVPVACIVLTTFLIHLC